MVKGISRQVIVIQSPDRKLFEQAIFILRQDARNVTDEMLMKEAERAVRHPAKEKNCRVHGPLWACGGAVITGLAWLLTSLL